MIFGSRFFQRHSASSSPVLDAALTAWRMLPEPNPKQALSDVSFAIVDIDVTGTSVRDDQVVGLAVALVEEGRLDMQQIHHFQFDGHDPLAFANALGQFLQVLGRKPLVTYNHDFVVSMLDANLSRLGLPDFPKFLWLDQRWLLPALHGGELTEQAGLTGWVNALGVPMLREHHAVSDVYAMAHLWIMLMQEAEAAGLQTFAELVKSQEGRRWLRG